jgi:V/A-type H+/Na+-transporting ATPase subunit D
MDQVSPTRTEMLTRQAQIRLAQQGADLLRSKREALVREFLAELRRYVEARKTMRKSMLEAVQCLMQSMAVDGPEAVAAAGLVCQRPVTVELTPQNIWGTKVVNLESEYKGHTPEEHGYGALTSTRLDEATEQFEEALIAILRVAPMDLKLRALAEDMRKTSRRVNALEQRLLPQLDSQVRYIQNALDQREREDIFRLKRLKRKKTGSP